MDTLAVDGGGGRYLVRFAIRSALDITGELELLPVEYRVLIDE